MADHSLLYWRRPGDMATVLAQAGFEVDVLYWEDDLPDSGQYTEQPFTMKRVLTLKKWPPKLGIFVLTLAMLWNGLKQNYDVYYGYNWSGFFWAFLCARIFRQRQLFYHSAEYFSWEERRSLLKWFELRFSRQSDLITCPEHNRAKLMKDELRLREYPTVVMNCPLFSPFKRQGFLREKLKAEGYQFEHVVIQVGGMADWRCSEELILAAQSLRSSTVIVMIGYGDPDYLAYLDELIEQVGVSHRVVRLAAVSYQELEVYISSCDAGLVLYKNINKNVTYVGSSKIGDYLRSGLPIIASENPVMTPFIQQHKIGCIVDGQDPTSIAEGIDSIILDFEKSRDMARRSRELFDSHYHYQYQAKPVVELIRQTFCGSEPSQGSVDLN